MLTFHSTMFPSPRDIRASRIYDRFREFPRIGNEAIRETFAKFQRLRRVLGRKECTVPPDPSVARSGKGEKETTQEARPRRHPMSDRQAPVVSGPHVSVHTASAPMYTEARIQSGLYICI